MAQRLAIILLLAAAALAAEALTAFEAAGPLELARTRASDGELFGAGTCNGLVGECGGEDDELGLSTSDEARRILYRRSSGRHKFISYAVLEKNRIPCNRRGQSYYNCRNHEQVNPYRRACTAITKCARDLS